MVDSSKKGDRRERELCRLFSGEADKSPFDLDEWGVMRAPASGSATVRELPDVLVGNGESFYAIEAKASGGNPIYIGGDEIRGLGFFSRNFGAEPLVGARFDRKPWYFLHPEKCHTTDGGNYRVKLERAEEVGLSLADL